MDKKEKKRICSTPLKHFIKIRQVGDLQHGAVLAKLLQGTEERPESLEDDVFYVPPPRVHLSLLKRAPCMAIVTSLLCCIKSEVLTVPHTCFSPGSASRMYCFLME